MAEINTSDTDKLHEQYIKCHNKRIRDLQILDVIFGSLLFFMVYITGSLKNFGGILNLIGFSFFGVYCFYMVYSLNKCLK